MQDQPTLESIQRWFAECQDVTGDDVPEPGLVDQIRALEELKGAAAAAQARLTASLYAARATREAAEGVPAGKRCAGLGTEVALARRVSPHQGNQHLGTALGLTREMPSTLAALSAGQISEWQATVMVRETAVLSAEHRREVDRQVGSRIAGSGWGLKQLRGAASAAGYRLDPTSAVRRTRGAESDRRVTVRPAPDTMTYVTTFVPVAQGVACKAALTLEAGRRKAAGDPRSRDQIMADVLVARVTGQDEAKGIPVQLGLVMTDKSLFAGSAEPAHVVGFGPIPAETARSLVRDADKVWLRRLYTSPESGALVAMDSRSRFFSGQLRHLVVLVGQVCANAWCDAPIRHADHAEAVREGGETTFGNAAGVCEACNYTKDLPGWHATMHTWSDGTRVFDITTPTGHRYRSRAPDPPGAVDVATRMLRRIAVA